MRDKYKITYNNRDERNAFIARELGGYLGKSILNIGGGGKHHLKKYLSNNTIYTELDIDGAPDLKIDLEKDLPIQIADNSYNTIVCTDVLEHLDNLHEVFAELVRITDGYIIISLPNPINDSLAYLKNKTYKSSAPDKRKKFGKYIKYYGLPYVRPPDRHKWFFGYTDAEEFFIYNAKRYNLDICEMFPIQPTAGILRFNFIKLIIRLLLGDEVAKNIFATSFWVILKKL